MPNKRLIRLSRARTADERRIADETRRFGEREKDAILARGRAVKARRDASVAALRETFQVLKAERQAQGVTLQELQERTGIGRGALSRLENEPDPNPTVRTLQRYAAALGKQIVVSLTDA